MNSLNVNFITITLVKSQQIFLARYLLVQKILIFAKNDINTIFLTFVSGTQRDKEFMSSFQLFFLVLYKFYCLRRKIC